MPGTRKLGRTSDSRRAMLRAMVTYLFEKGKIETTVAPVSYTHLGLKMAVAGNRIGDISHAIQEYVEAHGYSVVREFVGRGLGRELHEDPEVPNYGHPGRGARLVPGMTLAIEPMVNAGTAAVRQLGDGWTVKTKDGALSAHFENSIVITANGPVILTDPN